ncbi:MAG TPA: NifB/NifX family molybdenum-iron cluster-binding protein [Anaerolineae bacterium]|nr:NifB/NifX family molybdenum-iron cluster-binding protein [Anaerolineae bacterium]
MKIAAVTEDGVTISQHFGRAPYYVVLTVEDGQVVGREQREKVAHGRGADGHVHVAGQAHGFDAASQDTHGRMAAPIADCQVLLARGMGIGAYESLQQAGIRPIITDIAAVDEAVAAYLAGTLTNHTERLH